MLKPLMVLNALNACWSDLETDPMPLFYHGFVPAAILLMVISLGVRQLWEYWKQYHQKL